MFERLKEHGRALAERRGRALRQRLAETLGRELPRDIRAEAAPEGVRLTGRGLSRRLVLDRALAWLLAGLR